MAKNGLADGLAAEHEAIFAYGVAGAQLSGDVAATAATAEQAHRDRRDAIAVQLSKSDASAPDAKPAYALPVDVNDADSAIKLITEVETQVCQAWRATLPNVDQDDRRVAAESFAAAAMTNAAWRRAIGESPSTRAFPGRP